MAEVSLFDSKGVATAYIAEDGEATIYLWRGEAVAYVHSDHVYGFNGLHLGWFDDGIVRDAKGECVGFVKTKCPVVTKVEPVKKVKKVKKVKSVRKVSPVRPVNRIAISAIPFLLFLQQGQK